MHHLRGFLLLICLAGGVSVSDSFSAEPSKKVLIIGIDGCRFDALQSADTPQLDQLIADGCYDPDCDIVGERYQGNDTISGPGWSSILTGVWADKHGVNDNTFKGKNYEKYPHIFERLKESLPDAYAASVVTWVPIQTYIVSAADEGLSYAPENKEYAAADAVASLAAQRIVTQQNPTILFYYIGQVDEAGHSKGFHPSVQEYVAAIEQADKHVGEVVTAMRSRLDYANEQWLIIITSDHGGRGLGHSGGHQVPEIRNSFLVVSGTAAMRGRIEKETYLTDVVPTALTHLDVNLKAEWALDGQAVGLRSGL